jgi:putative flippase GtrA
VRGAERSRQARFVVVGIWNTVFAYAVWAALQVVLGDRLHYLAILVLAWPIAVLNAYLCQRRFVFRSTGSILTELPRFSAVYVITLAASLALLPVLLQILPFSIYVVQAGFTVIVVILSYLAHRSFSFAPSAGSRTGRPGGAP